jgi:fibronectin-binding autotransporter adhesin
MNTKRILFTSVATLLSIQLATTSVAAPLEWAGSTTGLTGGTDNTWNTNTTANWWDGVGLVNWPALGGTDDDAIFGGTAGVVTITTATANDLTFNTTGYTLTGGTLTLNGTTPTITNGSGIDVTISSVINGLSGLAKSGAGTLTLSGASGYSGGTTLSGGTIVVGDNSALGSGTLTMNGGTLTAGGASRTLSNNLHIDGSGSVFNAPLGADLVLNGNMTGSGSVSVNGQWAVVLGGDNSGFTGTWTSGSLGPNNITRFNAANSGSASAAWVLNGGRMISEAAGGSIISLGSLSGNGGILSNNTSGQVTYSIGALNTDTTFSGQIVNQWGGGGTAAITKVGAGTLTLSGGLGYSGVTTVSGGTLKVSSAVNYGDAMSTSGIVLENGATLSLYLAGNNPYFNMPISGTGNLVIDGIAGGLPDSNRLVMNTPGAGNTFTGNVDIRTNGKLQVWGGNVAHNTIPDASIVNVDGDFTIWDGGTETIGGLTGGGTIHAGNGSGALTISNSANHTFSGKLEQWAGSTLNLIKTGSGTQTISGNNTYTGTTTVDAGTLQLSGTNANGNLRVNGVGALARITGGTTTLASTSGNTYVTGGGTLEIDGGSLVIQGGAAFFPVGDHPAIPDGTGTLTLTSGSFTNNNSWGIVVGEGNAGAGTINVNGGVFTANDTVNNTGIFLGVLAGGVGTLNLNGGTLITDKIQGGGGSGTVNFNGGKLQATGDVAEIFANHGNVTTTILAGGLKVGGTPNFTISEAMAGAGGLTKEDSNIVTISGNNTYTGSTSVSGGTLTFARTANHDYSTSSIINNANVIFSPTANAAMFFDSQLSGSGTFTVDGPGGGNIYQNRVVLKGTATASDNTGPINVINSGRLWLETTNAMVAPSTVINLNGAATVLSLYGTGTRTIGGLNSTGGNGTVDLLDIGGGTPSLSIGTGDVTSSFSGVIKNTVGSLALTKTGTGTLTLSGNNTYTGATTVNAGTLLVSGSISGSAVTVNNGGTLGGTGTTGAVTALSGATVAPGASPGILSTGALSMSSGSTLSIEINGLTLGTDYDQLSVTGAVDITGATLSLGGTYLTTPAVTNDLFTILLNDGTSDAIIGTFAGLAEGAHVFSGIGQDYTISYIGGDGNDIVLTAVPEPGSAALLLGGLALLGARRRRGK